MHTSSSRANSKNYFKNENPWYETLKQGRPTSYDANKFNILNYLNFFFFFTDSFPSKFVNHTVLIAHTYFLNEIETFDFFFIQHFDFEKSTCGLRIILREQYKQRSFLFISIGYPRMAPVIHSCGKLMEYWNVKLPLSPTDFLIHFRNCHRKILTKVPKASFFFQKGNFNKSNKDNNVM